MKDRDPVDAAFALALLGLEGVGRVTAQRLLERFPTYDGVLSYPREQVLLRLKGAPNAERTVGRIFDRMNFDNALNSARNEMKELARNQIHIISEGHPDWPIGLADLPRSARPVVLYAFGSTECLRTRSAALHARPPLQGQAFEAMQSVARMLIEKGLPIICGAESGFDVVLQKLSAGAKAPCVMVARCGLAKVESKIRPSAAAAVKAGGVLISSFPPQHGPFDHDDAERALLKTALAGPSVFVAPREHTPEAHALEWALKVNKPLFGIAGDEAEGLAHFPERVHLLNRPVDYDWVVAATQTVPTT